MKVHRMSDDRKIKILPEPGVRELLEGYIAEQNALNAPAKLSITAVVNAAIREYIASRREVKAA